MSRWKTTRSFVLSLCFVGLGCSPPADSKAGGPPPPAEVEVAQPVVRSIVEWDSYTGRLAAVESVELRSRASGYLRSVHFEEGQSVEKGQLLFVVDPRPFEVAVQSAQAARKQAAARLAVAKADLVQATADRGRVQAQLELARLQEQRAEAMQSEGTLTQEELDERRSQGSQAEAQLAAADAAIAASQAAIESAEADAAAAEVTVAGAQLELSYTEIRAPVSGRADRHLVTVGNFVQGGTASGTLLTTIVSVDPIHCYFDANEQALLKYLRLAQAGKRQSSRQAKNPAYMRLVDEEGYPHRGHMDFVGNQVNTDSATIRGRAIFANADGLLQAGLFARVWIPGSSPHEAVLIPDSAVGSDQSERYVLVVDEAGAVERRAVKLGPLHSGLRIVHEGVAAGDRLIVNGLQRVRPGATVAPKEIDLSASLPQGESGLPNTYEPVPESEWLGKRPEPELAGDDDGKEPR